jgi:hypothetical protein
MSRLMANRSIGPGGSVVSDAGSAPGALELAGPGETLGFWMGGGGGAESGVPKSIFGMGISTGGGGATRGGDESRPSIIGPSTEPPLFRLIFSCWQASS